MSKSGFVARCAAVTVGSMLLAGVAGIAMAAEPDDAGVDVNVSIAEINEPGVLAMSVADTTTTLTEEGSTATVRQFTGTLPTVTVTDTRTADEIPDDAFWSVVGSSTDFTGDAGQPTIGAGHLGWAPNLIDGGSSGQVSQGEQVDTVLDSGPDNVGLVDQELLAMAFDSGDIAAEGQWTANASLFLRTPATVAAGDYTARLTLSLFE
ncbi:hypothetical protein [Agromyces laixinhei]|uniref:hypothetical protein n=1 Tax=Agromyces laixinhei TaxID=2585717 RepID=UPI001116E932|nr:hypothetical protein [Agromyces laixinhei]